MDNLPLGPMLAVIALLILWAALFTAIEAAQQHLMALRPGTRQGDKAAARLSFPRHSLILCNSLCRAAVVISIPPPNSSRMPQTFTTAGLIECPR